MALMITAIWQQRGRLESLISIGMSFSQFTRLIFYEIGSVLLVGCVLGVTFGLVGQGLIDGWLHHTTGASVQYAPAWQLGLQTIVIVAGISAAASMVAGIQTVQFGPAAFARESPSQN
jgi:ABC-type antimicrobial peptide transport system permease subunit